MQPSEREIEPGHLAPRLEALTGVERVRTAAAEVGVEAFLVGGSVRDLLLDRERTDLDFAIEGSPLAVAEALGGDLRFHERFDTAAVRVEGHVLDLAATRAETYPTPGALPEVRPAPLTADLARRDFTVNAMAVPLRGEPELIDPHDGLVDLRAAVLRDLHPRSFVDDPTRALRGARYAARLDLDLDPATLSRLRAADLDVVSADRVDAELRRLACEEAARRGFELLAEWGLIELAAGSGELIDAVDAVCARPEWSQLDHRADAVLAVTSGHAAGRELAAADPAAPSEAVRLARGHGPVDLLLARAHGAEWLDRYVSEWRRVRLEITGRDLLAAGVPEGPAIGRGLTAALEAKLDGAVPRRGGELAVALAAARGPGRDGH